MEEESGFESKGPRGFGMRTPKPIKVDQELDVTIEGEGKSGDGVAKEQGFVIFVPGAKKGDTVHIKITEMRNKFAKGEIVGKGEAATQTDEAEPASEAEPTDEAEATDETEPESE